MCDLETSRMGGPGPCWAVASGGGGVIVQLDNTRIPKTNTDWKISWKKVCGKITTEMGRQDQEGLLVCAV